MGNVTIYDVAEKAGVSIKTVSRIINKEANVSEKTRLKVEAAVEALNYRPSVSARGLGGNRSYILGLVYDVPSPAYVIDVQNGVLAACEEEGFGLLIYPCDHTQKDLAEDLCRLVKDSRLDGLVLTPPISGKKVVLDMLAKEGVPVTLVAPPEFESGPPSVCTNDIESAVAMTRHLLSLGHRRIAYIKGHEDHPSSRLRLRGYRAAMKEAGIKEIANLIVQGKYDFESGEACARKLLSLDEPPSAIFASNDYMAAGVIKVASLMGFSIPGDLSVTGFDDAPISRQMWPMLTTIQQPVVKMAGAAAHLLITLVRRGEVAERELRFDSRLIIRESTGPCQIAVSQ
ncbi:MAG: LacI family DNA-binding transcriptional regulator [Pseudomonadales bacterium]